MVAMPLFAKTIKQLLFQNQWTDFVDIFQEAHGASVYIKRQNIFGVIRNRSLVCEINLEKVRDISNT